MLEPVHVHSGTPADTAPNLEVDYGILDKETNAQEFAANSVKSP